MQSLRVINRHINGSLKSLEAFSSGPRCGFSGSASLPDPSFVVPPAAPRAPHLDAACCVVAFVVHHVGSVLTLGDVET